jgi:hypothetical protein
VATKPLLSLGTFLGVNNRLDATRLGVTLQGRVSATYLRIGENIDIHGGFFRLREGYSTPLTPPAHSVWGDGEPDGYAVVDGNLEQLRTSGAALQRTVVRYGMSGQPVSFERAPTGDIYWTDGVTLGRISAGQDRMPAAPAPNPVPNVSARPGEGTMAAGQYLFAFTRLTQDPESAATPVQRVVLPEAGGFFITGLQADTLTYASGPNGDVLTRVEPIGNALAVDSLGAGPRCETLLLQPLPAGQIVRHYNGRMLVARGNTLLFSEPYRYGLYNPAQSFIPLPGPITVMEPCVGGVFVCADQTYWLAGDLMGTQAVPVLPFGGVAGSGARSPDETQVCWVSPKGLVIGASDGTATAVQDDAVRFADAARAACLFRDWDGMSHVIYTRQGVQPLTTQARRRPLITEN